MEELLRLPDSIKLLGNGNEAGYTFPCTCVFLPGHTILLQLTGVSKMLQALALGLLGACPHPLPHF